MCSLIRYEDSVFPSHLLPKVVPVGTKVGYTSTKMSDWPHGIPVFVCMGDVQCATFALLNDRHDAGMCFCCKLTLRKIAI